MPVAESTRQPQSTPGSATLTVIAEGTTPPDWEGEKDIPQNPGLVMETPKGQEEGRGTLETGIEQRTGSRWNVADIPTIGNVKLPYSGTMWRYLGMNATGWRLSY